jgi:hypothetical protein
MRIVHTGENSRLQVLLKNEEIRELIRTVDSSPNPLGALRSILSQAKFKDSLFQETMDEMLKALGYLSPDGQSQF